MTSAGKQFHRSGFREPKTQPSFLLFISVCLFFCVCVCVCVCVVLYMGLGDDILIWESRVVKWHYYELVDYIKPTYRHRRRLLYMRFYHNHYYVTFQTIHELYDARKFPNLNEGVKLCSWFEMIGRLLLNRDPSSQAVTMCTNCCNIKNSALFPQSVHMNFEWSPQ
jgi:hypothetical protein